MRKQVKKITAILSHLLQSITTKVVLIILLLVLPLNILAIVLGHAAITAMTDQAKLSVASAMENYSNELQNRMEDTSYLLWKMKNDDTDGTILCRQEGDESYRGARVRFYYKLLNNMRMGNGADGYFFYMSDLDDLLVWDRSGASKINTQKFVREELGNGIKQGWTLFEVEGRPILCMFVRIRSLPEQNMAVKEYIEHRGEFKKYAVFYSAYSNMQVIMCLSSGTNGKEKILGILQGVIRIWKRGEDHCYIGYSYKQTLQSGIPEVYRQAREAMSYALFIGDCQLIDSQSIQAGKRLPRNIRKSQEELLRNLATNNKVGIRKGVTDFMEECKRLHTEPNLVKHFILEFVYSALSMERKKEDENGYSRIGTQINDEYECPPHMFVNQCTSYEQLTEWFGEELERIADSMSEENKGNKNRRQIEAVKEHIHTYYQKDLSLFELAEIAKMTPAYFSNVFKQEVGITYIKYLTKVRLEKAKVLLSEGYKVIEVSSMVGYENYRYFCVIFKKYTGVTAQQFKWG